MRPAGRRYHMSVTRRHLYEMVRRDGAKDTLENWDGTDEDALQTILYGPDSYVIGPCTNQSNGRCFGHPIEDVRSDPIAH